VQRINVADGKVVSTSDKQINNSMLSGDQNNADDDDDDKTESKEDKKKRAELKKMQEEGEGFSKCMQFRKIFYTADNGLVILAERYDHYVTSLQSYTSGVGNLPGQWGSTTYSIYLSGDLMMCKVDASGNIGWLQIVPKNQREEIAVGSSFVPGGGTAFGMTYFGDQGRPFYSGFGALQANGRIQLLLNDNRKNISVNQAGQKAKPVYRFGKSDCFILNIDETSGKVDRKVFFSNTDIPTAMPRLGVVIGNDMYLVGKTDRTLSKSKIAVGKITIK
jgi:hypothetical protein